VPGRFSLFAVWPKTPPKKRYRTVDAAYEKRSVAISSNLHHAAFDERTPLCQTTGDSARLTQAVAGNGVAH